MPILRTHMRPVLLVVVLVALLLAPAAGAGERPALGALSIEGGRGVITLKVEGGVLGKLDGVVQIVDLTPRDRWSPIVNGVTVKRATVQARGEGVSFRVLGGRFKIVARGENISISARGRGTAVLRADNDGLGAAGLYATDATADCVTAPETCQAVPETGSRVVFGLPVTPAPVPERDDAKEKNASTERSR
jgi:hypothetical protein